jgi:hypothetical protein
VIQGTIGVIQGTIGVIQGTIGVIQGTIGVIQGTIGMILQFSHRAGQHSGNMKGTRREHHRPPPAE